MQGFRTHMPVAAAKQQPGQRQALARGAKARKAQFLVNGSLAHQISGSGKRINCLWGRLSYHKLGRLRKSGVSSGFVSTPGLC